MPASAHCPAIQIGSSHQLLPQQCQVKPVDHTVCVTVSDLPLPLRQRVRSQEIPLEEYSVGDGEDTITVQVAGSAAAT